MGPRQETEGRRWIVEGLCELELGKQTINSLSSAGQVMTSV